MVNGSYIVNPSSHEFFIRIFLQSSKTRLIFYRGESGYLIEYLLMHSCLFVEVYFSFCCVILDVRTKF